MNRGALVAGSVEDVQYVGAELRVRVALDMGGRVVAAVPSHERVDRGNRVGLAWAPDAVRSVADTGAVGESEVGRETESGMFDDGPGHAPVPIVGIP